MKAIQIKSNQIEIPFQDNKGNIVETFYFERTDDSLKKVMDEIEKLDKEIKSSNEDTFTDEDAKKLIVNAADSLLGKGSFDKLYALNPSIQIVTYYIYQVAIGIKGELESETIKDVENQYLK